jgi:lipid-binding SYLF domain-containing protein
MKATGMRWGKAASDKAVKVNDYVGPKINSFAENRFGTHAFWPTSGDFGAEMDKAAAILREFTVSGVVTTDKKSKRKVLRKVPPAVLKDAQGLAIFTSMRSGIAPLGGAGGAGVVVARLEDGSWSAPASISPQNISTGFLIGIDVYDCILVIRTRKALESFYGHKVTLGTEIGVAAGPYGVGAAMEAGREAAPVFSYVKSRGMYAGVEVVGQIFASRFDENAAMYNWPGIKAGDILTGKVKIPREAADLQKALEDAASGRAQKRKGSQLDVPVDELAQTIVLEDGEVLKLPPTPDQTDGREYESDPETETVIRRSKPPALPPRRGGPPPALPPRHPRHSDEMEPNLLGSASVGASPHGSPRIAPPLPPRSAARPQSMVIAPTALAFPTSPTSPVDRLEQAVVPVDSPPSYETAEALPADANVHLTPLPTNALLAAPSAGASPASTYSALDEDVEHLSLGATSPAPKVTALEPSPAPVPESSAPVMPEGEMSESERREWEQHWEEERRKAAAADKGKQKEDESLL